jgi:hypothetical protein
VNRLYQVAEVRQPDISYTHGSGHMNDKNPGETNVFDEDGVDGKRVGQRISRSAWIVQNFLVSYVA